MVTPAGRGPGLAGKALVRYMCAALAALVASVGADPPLLAVQEAVVSAFSHSELPVNDRFPTRRALLLGVLTAEALYPTDLRLALARLFSMPMSPGEPPNGFAALAPDWLPRSALAEAPVSAQRALLAAGAGTFVSPTPGSPSGSALVWEPPAWVDTSDGSQADPHLPAVAAALVLALLGPAPLVESDLSVLGFPESDGAGAASEESDDDEARFFSESEESGSDNAAGGTSGKVSQVAGPRVPVTAAPLLPAAAPATAPRRSARVRVEMSRLPPAAAPAPSRSGRRAPAPAAPLPAAAAPAPSAAESAAQMHAPVLAAVSHLTDLLAGLSTEVASLKAAGAHAGASAPSPPGGAFYSQAPLTQSAAQSVGSPPPAGPAAGLFSQLAARLNQGAGASASGLAPAGFPTSAPGLPAHPLSGYPYQSVPPGRSPEALRQGLPAAPFTSGFPPGFPPSQPGHGAFLDAAGAVPGAFPPQVDPLSAAGAGPVFEPDGTFKGSPYPGAPLLSVERHIARVEMYAYKRNGATTLTGYCHAQVQTRPTADSRPNPPAKGDKKKGAAAASGRLPSKSSHQRNYRELLTLARAIDLLEEELPQFLPRSIRWDSLAAVEVLVRRFRAVDTADYTCNWALAQEYEEVPTNAVVGSVAELHRVQRAARLTRQLATGSTGRSGSRSSDEDREG